jgi:hypothetical protein
MSDKPAPRNPSASHLSEGDLARRRGRSHGGGRDLSGVLAAALNLYLRTSVGETLLLATYGKEPSISAGDDLLDGGLGALTRGQVARSPRDDQD